MRKPSPENKQYIDEYDSNGLWSNNEDSRIVSHDNSFKNALAVMDNIVARATTRWTLEESKLFICALSKVKTRDSDGWVKLKKNDLKELLGYEKRSTLQLRELFKDVAIKSWIELGNNNEWNDGFILTQSRSDRWNVYYRFNDYYFPLLDKLSERFTSIYVESIASLESKGSYNLYLYLKSWGNSRYATQERKIFKNEIHRIFNLKPESYWRKYGTEQAKFDWDTFERKVLKKAIDDINSQEGKSEIYITGYHKIKTGRWVDGYLFEYILIDENGMPQ